MFWPMGAVSIIAIWPCLFYTLRLASSADEMKTADLLEYKQNNKDSIPTTVITPVAADKGLLNLLNADESPSYSHYYQESPPSRSDDLIYDEISQYSTNISPESGYEDKRAHNLMHFGKRDNFDTAMAYQMMEDLRPVSPDDLKRGHNLMRFGKRGDSYDDDLLDYKRGHNLMRFGKRNAFLGIPEELKRAHKLIHFGKRGDFPYSESYLDEKRAHNLMHFGKRDSYPTISEYEKKTHNLMRFGKRDMDDKRAHNLMHFGKRDDDEKRAHNLMHFGKRDDDEKRAHNLMHFGKRDDDEKRAHNLMHFGKRDDFEDKRAHNLMHFGKRDDFEDKRAHNLMHFGKRDDIEDKRAHTLMHFGKRDEYDIKRGHNLMRFGKREDFDDKRAHNLMHFGKRESEDLDDKRAHNLMHFGKRETEDFDEKRAHNLMHFGKRETEDFDEKRAHNLMHFGKREDDEKRGHQLMHFGKRDEELGGLELDEALLNIKRGSHNLMHFGKREMANDEEPSYLPEDPTGNQFQIYSETQGNDLEELKDALSGKDYVRYSGEMTDFKRGHNLMRFGKRLSSNGDQETGSGITYENDSFNNDDDKRAHNLMHFGKRETKSEESKLITKEKNSSGKLKLPTRSRVPENVQSKTGNQQIMHLETQNEKNIPIHDNQEINHRKRRSIRPYPFTRTLDMYSSPAIKAILDQLARVPRDDTKRGHNIMRFGKRGDNSNRIMHFGKRAIDRSHKLMHFGKRSPELNEEVAFGDDSDDYVDNWPREGIDNFDLDDVLDDNQYFLDLLDRDLLKRGHGIMHFGKRDQDDDDYNDLPFDDNQLPAMDLYSQKRSPGVHPIMHFGKRNGVDADAYLVPAMMRRTHALLHFGKRDSDESREEPIMDADDSYSPLKRYHNLLHFGKRRSDNDDSGDYDQRNRNRKRPEGHNILRFGKRSIPESEARFLPSITNVSSSYQLNPVRRKRHLNQPDYFLQWNGSLFSPNMKSSSERRSSYLLPHTLSATQVSAMRLPLFVGHLHRIQRAAFPYYVQNDRKNVFLHFG